MRNLFLSIAIHVVLIAGAFIAARGFDPKLAAPRGAIEVGAVGTRERRAKISEAVGDSSPASSSDSSAAHDSGPDSASNPGGSSSDATALASISARIERNLEYPLSLRRLGISGETRVHMKVAADGALSALDVAQSSGQARLDELALSAVRKSAPFEAEIAGRDIELPIRFRIQQP